MLSLKEIAEITNSALHSGNPMTMIKGIASLDQATADHISFFYVPFTGENTIKEALKNREPARWSQSKLKRDMLGQRHNIQTRSLFCFLAEKDLGISIRERRGSWGRPSCRRIVR